jgi:Arc/MetJ-type ribon-helix-helix transcriptional regulator
MATARSSTTITISLSKSLREYVDLQVQVGLAKSPSDYVLRLLKKKQREEMDWLEAKLLASLDSGPSIPMDEKFWAEFDARSRNPTKRPGR